MKLKKKDFERDITHLLFVLPSFLLYSILSVFPIVAGIYYSFTNWNGISKKIKFIGLDNYKDIFRDPRFFKAITFNIKYALFLMIFVVTISICLALLLNKNIRCKSFFRAVYFFPAVISMLTAGLIFNEIFYRAIPQVGKILRIAVLQNNILASTKTAIYGILSVHVWQGVAIPTVLILAGLQTIPNEIIESASLDGANKWQQFIYITVPFILPILSIVLVLVLKDGLMVYDYVMGLTGGGPAGVTESITLLLYRQGFEEMKFSYSIAESIIVSLILITISFVQIQYTNRKKVY